MLSRRSLLACIPAAASAAPRPKLRIGVMDGLTGQLSHPASVEIAKRLGFEGLQITLGRQAASGHLPLASEELQRGFLHASRAHKLPLVSTYIDILHVNCLKSDREAVRWSAEGIEITRRLNARILMLVFFGKCALESRAEMDAVVGPLKELAREAEKAKVILGFENTIHAADDIRILDQVGSSALKIYYDIGNATNLYNADPLAEIRALGRDRICQFHYKDKGYLGEGKVDVPGALRAIAEIGWQGDIVLETGSPSKDREADLKRNLTYLRGLL